MGTLVRLTRIPLVDFGQVAQQREDKFLILIPSRQAKIEPHSTVVPIAMQNTTQLIRSPLLQGSNVPNRSEVT